MGGRRNAAMDIAARVVQRVGAGGTNIWLDIICCNLVLLNQQSKYVGRLFAWLGIAAAQDLLGGGALAH